MKVYLRAMEKPLVSILIPFKNTSPYLNACVDSILAQSYDNWELIMINDHSTDTSFSLVEAYTKQDQRIKVYNNTGKGIIEALRLAFSKSNGELITRMDSDDLMADIKLEVMINDLLKYGKGHLALGLVKYFSESGLGEGYTNYEKWLNKLTRTGINYTEIYKECVIPSPCWLLHRDDLINCGAFDANRYPEDYDLAFRFYEANYKCIPSTDILHYWRDYPTRTSRTDPHYEQNYFLDLKVHYFIKLNYNAKRPLVIWGAGSKGKNVARILIDKKVPFYWICDNPKKIGKDIYNQKLLEFKCLSDLKNPQSIITVANVQAQKEIKSFLHAEKMMPMTDYFFFC